MQLVNLQDLLQVVLLRKLIRLLLVQIIENVELRHVHTLVNICIDLLARCRQFLCFKKHIVTARWHLITLNKSLLT